METDDIALNDENKLMRQYAAQIHDGVKKFQDVADGWGYHERRFKMLKFYLEGLYYADVYRGRISENDYVRKRYEQGLIALTIDEVAAL